MEVYEGIILVAENKELLLVNKWRKSLVNEVTKTSMHFDILVWSLYFGMGDGCISMNLSGAIRTPGTVYYKDCGWFMPIQN